MNTFILDILSLGAVLSSVLVVTSKNPVISVLFLISVFINAAGYLLMLGVGFVGISYLIVYVGAIAILFLFVIIMLNIQLDQIVSVGREYTKNIPLGFVLSLLLFLELLSVDTKNTEENLWKVFDIINAYVLNIKIPFYLTQNYLSYYNNAEIYFTSKIQIESMGELLYTTSSIWLMLASIILLLAIIGPILLCLQKNNYQ